MDIEQYLEENFIAFEKSINNTFIIEGFGKCLFIEHKKGKLFDDSLNILFSEDEERSVYEDNIDYLIFQFGNNFFYSSTDVSSKFEIHSLRYIGQADTDDPFNYPFLGIHGKYELLNGCFDYELWCKKAKFLNIQTLGICEKNTLAGTLPFQLECEKHKIKSILGETVTVKLQTREQFDLKLYVINEIGWKNLVQINSLINLEEVGRFIELDNLLALGEGLIAVIDPFSFMLNKQIVNNIYVSFDKVYYQIDSIVVSDDNVDKIYLNNLKQFVHSKLSPILINDAYYLDKEDVELKTTLNSIAGVISPITKDQHFKTYLENERVLMSLFKDDGEYFDFIEKAIGSLFEVEELCEFQINTKEKYLPKYERKGEELKKYSSNEEFFIHLLNEGFRREKINFLSKDDRNCQWEDVWEDTYRERLDYEISVIKEGGFIDYFLILWDIVQYCRDNQILIGLGRGSAAGSLVSYLLGITSIDPIEYGLLFERFLNSARISKKIKEEFIYITDNQNNKYKIKADKEIKVSRNGQIIKIKAGSLQKKDKVYEENLSNL